MLIFKHIVKYCLFPSTTIFFTHVDIGFKSELNSCVYFGNGLKV